MTSTLDVIEVDEATRAWIRNASDERAVRNGCRFDEERGQFVVDWIQRYCRLYEGEWAGQPMTLSDWQLDCTLRIFGWVRWSEKWQRWIRRFRQASIWVPKKNKKPIALDTPIPTPSGWILFGSLAVGDELFDESGNVCRVTNVTETYTGEDCYRLTFVDGTSIVAGAGHEWFAKRKTQHRRGIFETEEMYRTQAYGKERRPNYFIPKNGPLECPWVDLPIDPYLLGAWLGDGASGKGQIDVSEGDDAILHGITNRYPITSSWKNTGRSTTYQLTGLQTDLKRLGVFRNKHIPSVYLRASIDQREALLQGLMDTDGCVGPKGQCIYITTSDLLKDGVVELLRSLAYKPTARLVATSCQTPGWVGKAWRILFHAHSGCNISRLQRKQNKLPELMSVNRWAFKSVVSIDRVPTVPVRCITVDSPSHLFLAGEGMIPTHNSPTLAAWGLYLLCGDGEPGQKVFLGAKDGTQAREIAGKHAIEMMQKSDELSGECDLNRSLMRITHRDSRSLMQPLSSSNERSQRTKEGLNGSVLIDETHVVDREFMSIISRAGISRSEPLQIEVSTAGNNPDGYGMERFKYAREVEQGEREDQELFAAIYAAPQELTDAELDADPLKWGRLANPAMGHTVDPEEFLTDYHRSKSSLRALLDFKMYRLNIWQRSSSPWIKSADWAKCRATFTEADLEGRECAAGLDLSRTRDMSALVLVFPMDEPETYRLLPFFWLPEDVAKENDHLAPFMTWARDGHLFLTPGNVIDYGYIRSTYRSLAERFRIVKLAYDKTYAEETTQALEQGVVDADGKQIEEGTGVERIIFAQTLMTFTAPCKDFERLVTAGKMQHNGHPILTWQAGHVQVRSDPNNNIRPMKPKPHDIKKIDGIVAAVQGYWAASTLTASASLPIEVW